jgi:hypothetical protein
MSPLHWSPRTCKICLPICRLANEMCVICTDVGYDIRSDLKDVTSIAPIESKLRNILKALSYNSQYTTTNSANCWRPGSDSR